MKDEFEKQARYFGLGETYFWLSGQNTIVEQRLRPALEETVREAAPRMIRILDMGCGPGNTLIRLSRWGRAYGMDYSLDALRFARNKGIQHVFSADSTVLPMQSESFDCVVALDVLEHVDDDETALREIARVLRPRGVFLLTVPAFMSLWRYHDEMYGHYRRYAKSEFTDKVRRAGLTITACHFFKCAFFPALWLLAKLERLRLIPRRDNFFSVPKWLNTAMESLIVWENSSGFARCVPFGVSLLCVGRR